MIGPGGRTVTPPLRRVADDSAVGPYARANRMMNGMKMTNKLLISVAVAATLAGCSAGGSSTGGAGRAARPVAASTAAPPVNLNPYPSTYRPYPSVPTALVGGTVLDGDGGRFE
ncbi:MAG: hypothetical protein ACKOUM_11050, partial [Sphingopyxis sp.]